MQELLIVKWEITVVEVVNLSANTDSKKQGKSVLIFQKLFQQFYSYMKKTETLVEEALYLQTKPNLASCR